MAQEEARTEALGLRRLRSVRVVSDEPAAAGRRVQGLVHYVQGEPIETALLIGDAAVDGHCQCNRLPRPCGHMLALARAWADQQQAPAVEEQRSWAPLFERLLHGGQRTAPAEGGEAFVHWIGLVRRRRTGPFSLTVRWRLHRVGPKGLGRGQNLDPQRVSFDTPRAATEADERVLEAVLMGFLRRRIYSPLPPVLEVEGARVDPVLRALARAPWVRWEEREDAPVFENVPFAPRLLAEDRGPELRLRLGWTGREPACPPEELKVVGSDPPWLACEGALAPVVGARDSEALLALLSGELFVPSSDLPLFLGSTVPALEARGLTVELSGIDARELVVSEAARPRLYLQEEGGTLVAQLRFGYGDFEITADNPLPVVPLATAANRVFLKRDMEAEFQAATLVRRLGLRAAEPGRFEIDGDRGLEFVSEHLEALAAQWEIYGREGLRQYRTAPGSVSLRLKLQASLDWLDLQVEGALGDEPVESSEILAALRRRSKYVRLGNGAHALLPKEWLERTGSLLLELGWGKGKARLPTYLAPALEESLHDAPGLELAGRPFWDSLLAGLRDPEGLPEEPLPRGLRGELRPYQERGYRWLRFLERHALSGILADDMGLGKTVQALALLLGEAESGRAGPNLVVAPTSVVPNWEVEATRFAPSLRVYRYQGSARKDLLAEFATAGLVLTSYSILRRDIDELGAIQWNYAILDEGQAIKNASSLTARCARRLTARRRLTLTGTPLENHLGELWSQFQFLMPGLLGGEKHFAARYARPISQGEPGAADALRRRIRPFILRRLKGQVASELPEKVESLLLCQMGSEQQKLYRTLLVSYRERVFREVAERGFAKARMSILDALLRLRQVCCHPGILPGEVGKDVPSAKFEAFCEFVAEVVDEGHRVLVFSQFVKLLQILRRWFEEQGISHLYLDGRTRDRESRVRQFQEDDSVSAFLVSLKAGGTGLNLTGADYVILYDPWWNPAVEAQAADRAHRIGQTRKVFSYKLITKDSVEEKILALQERKRSLTQELIRSEGELEDPFTQEDLEELFEV